MRLYFTWILILFCAVVNAQNAFVVHGTPPFTEGVNIDSVTLFYEDKSEKPLTFEHIQYNFSLFRPFSEKRNEHTTTSDVTVLRIWLKFIVKNTHPTDTAQLMLTTGAHGYISLYQKNQPVKKTGFYFSTHGIATGTDFIHFTVRPNQTDTIFTEVIDFKGSIVPISASLHTYFTSLKVLEQGVIALPLLFLLLSIFVGSLLFMFLYSLYHYWLTRQSVFGYYALYVSVAMIAIELNLEVRFGFSYLSHLFTVNLPKQGGATVIGFNLLIPVLYILFVSKIIDVPKHTPRLWIVLKIMVIVLILQQLLTYYQSFTLHYFYKNTYYRYENFTTLSATAFLIIATFRSKSPIKGYILAGILSFMLLICFPMVAGAFRPDWFYNAHLEKRPDIEALVNFFPFWPYLGLTVEALCFALALAYRSYLIEKDNKNMQFQYTQTLEQELIKQAAEIKAQNKILEEQHIKQLETVFEQRLIQTEMSALRAQMNPHFIFNCLNSIKLYTLENNSVTAADYLSKFSKLIRLVLENSRSEKITLENELETLCLYMDMEAMRFKNKMKYNIDIDSSIDAQFVEIPPLLLQPYVENAIWHGLMHREEGGLIKIDIKQPKENLLTAVITDNGIGRKAAIEFKSKSATKQKSLGMKMTTDRIELINQKFQDQTHIQIIDLVDTEGVALGTKVIVEISI